MTLPIIVLKVGTSSLVDADAGVTRLSHLARIVEAAMRLRRCGFHVILVSSGAVGLGCARMSLRERPTSIAGKQAAAAVGQVRLMSLYDDLFSVLGAICAQVLLTYDTFGERTQYLNARNTLVELLRGGIVPIINENDTVAVQEIRVGDNDTLSALVAAMVGAQWLMLMTDVDALYDANPRLDSGAQPIRSVPTHRIQELRTQMQRGAARLTIHGSASVLSSSESDVHADGAAGSQWGTGGMQTKLKAAQLATAAGVTVVIANTSRIEDVAAVLLRTAVADLQLSSSSIRTGSVDASLSPADVLSNAKSASSVDDDASHPNTLVNAFVDALEGTTFFPAPRPVTGRKRWLLSLAPQGTLVLDSGAVSAVVEQRKSLFPAGVVKALGIFEAQDCVRLVAVSDESREIARALVNYPSVDVLRLLGRRSRECADILGYPGAETLCDRDNIVLLK